MNLKVIDFDTLTRNFKPYVDGINNIDSEKKAMLESIQPIKKEMESILSKSQSGLILSDMDQKRDVDRFRYLQDSLMKSDMEFKNSLKGMSDDLNTLVYEQLSTIISEWSSENSIDLVIGKMEVVFNKPEFEATNDILEIIKEKNLYFIQ
jgi:Skp family chaperone for outer membrane proteins